MDESTEKKWTLLGYCLCAKLEREGLGGERCHFPVKTWVEPIEAKAV